MNSDKCHFFISGNKFEHLWAKIVIKEYGKKKEQSNSYV